LEASRDWATQVIDLLVPSRVQRILLIGAHADDIEIGCGGTLLRLASLCPRAEVRYAVFCGDEKRQAEARAAAALFLAGFSKLDVTVFGFRDAYLPYLGATVKDAMESLKPFAPDLVFTHFRDDLHQDHRLLSSLTWNAFRDHLVLEYEIAKFDGDLAHPNFFITLDADTVARKCRLLHEAFPSQRSRQWFDDETFRALMRLRGIECNSPTKYAEAFHCRKLRV
jgi:LmbE family N-acetylglucosaminyl deacetylase